MFNKIGSIVAITLAMTTTAVSAQDMAKVYVNGMSLGDEAFVQDGRTYIPLRAVSEAMGAEVSWNDETKSAYVAFSEDDTIAKIVENVSPSVVAIVGNYKSGINNDSYNSRTAHGTGVIIKTNGTIVTNAHVVKDLNNLTVILYDGTSIPAKVLYSDETADIAIIKIDKIGLQPIQMAEKSDIVSGRTAIAIGTPLSLSMRNTVTRGVVSGAGVVLNDSYYRLIQTDTPINPGNSGGPLLNTKGEMIGINSSKYESVRVDSMAFAIPIDTVKYAIDQFEKYTKIRRPDVKVTLEQSWEAKIGLPTNKGITVKSSSNSSLQAGDTIYSVNGIDVHGIVDWNEALKDTFNGSSIDVNFERNGQRQTATINVDVL